MAPTPLATLIPLLAPLPFLAPPLPLPASQRSDTPVALRLPALVSDGMVLQRDGEARVWGWAPGAGRVTATPSWNGREVAARIDPDGRFEALLSTPAASGPHEIAIAVDGEPRATITDVWSGEVWLASGQSNMEWTIEAARWSDEDDATYSAAVAAADLPRVRFFQVANAVATEPREDCTGRWTAATPESVPHFSAVAFHFAARVSRELDVPVGIVQSDWGGTVCEAWTSEPALRAFGEFDAALDEIAAERSEPGSRNASLASLQARWWAGLAERETGLVEGWESREVDDEGWERVEVPGDPDPGFDGCLWFRRTIEVPQSFVGRELELHLGPIDDMDVVWLDGEEIGATREWNCWNEPRTYRVPASAATPGPHTIAVLCVDTGGGAGLHGDASTLRIHPVGAPEESFAIAGEWSWRRGRALGELRPFPQQGWFTQNTPTALFNAMIAPLAPYRFRGAIWYQGESNASRPQQYERLFATMIEDWRRVFRGEPGSRGFDAAPFPFYFVQLAPWARPDDEGEWSRIRVAQQRVTEGDGGPELPHTGMVVTTDVGNPHDIHPRRKLEVGERLANWALARTYAPLLPATDVRKLRFETAPHESPRLRSVVRASATRGELGLEGSGEVACLSLEFHAAASGFTTSDGAAPTTFEVAGTDGTFHPARAVLLAGKDGDEQDTIVVGAEDVADPVAVRFCWRAGDEPNLRTGAGLPLGPFEGRLSSD